MISLAPLSIYFNGHLLHPFELILLLICIHISIRLTLVLLSLFCAFNCLKKSAKR